MRTGAFGSSGDVGEGVAATCQDRIGTLTKVRISAELTVKFRRLVFGALSNEKASVESLVTVKVIHLFFNVQNLLVQRTKPVN
jgi:hypothetical protein